MISTKLLVYLSIGTAAMLIPIVIQGRWKGIKLWKSVLIAVVLTVCGTIGTYIWFFIENHRLGGTSFYGAVFVVPILFLPLAKLFRMPYHELVAMCAPAECVMLVIMKVQCLISDCCGGVCLYLMEDGTAVYFPSQIAELINALVLCIVLLVVSRKEHWQGNIYPLYMVLYGCTRFVLNFFRGEQSDFLLGLAPGGVWSVCSVAIGLIWLLLRKRCNTG